MDASTGPYFPLPRLGWGKDATIFVNDETPSIEEQALVSAMI